MDEFDVFMDALNRKISISLLIEARVISLPLSFRPLISIIVAGGAIDEVVAVYLCDAARRQRHPDGRRRLHCQDAAAGARTAHARGSDAACRSLNEPFVVARKHTQPFIGSRRGGEEIFVRDSVGLQQGVDRVVWSKVAFDEPAARTRRQQRVHDDLLTTGGVCKAEKRCRGNARRQIESK